MRRDANGSIYVIGTTTSTDLPGTHGTFQPNKATGFPNTTDIFVAKFDATGSKLLWATYLGGEGDDIATYVELDASGNIYIAGRTHSADFPVTESPVGDQPSLPDPLTGATFIVEIPTDRTRLVQSFLIPFSAIAVSGSGDFFVTDDSNVIHLDNHRNVIFSVSLGTGVLEPSSVCLDAAGDVYVIGSTMTEGALTTSSSYEPTFPNAGLGYTSYPISAAFIQKFDANGNLKFGTYFGAKYHSTGAGIAAVDSEGSIYFDGAGNLNFAATAGAYQTSSGPGYVAKLSSDGSHLLAFSYLPVAPAVGDLEPSVDGHVHLLIGDNVIPLHSEYLELRSSDFGVMDTLSSSEIAGEPNLEGMLVEPTGRVWLIGQGTIDSIISPTAYQKRASGNNSILLEFGPIQPTISAAVNAASFIPGPFAPGQLVTLFGSELGPNPGVSLALTGNMVSSSLGGMSVLFDGNPAPVLFASADQVNTVIPFKTEGEPSTRITIQNQGIASNVLTLPLAHSAPGIFTATGIGVGQGAILNEDSSVNNSKNPASLGSIVQIFTTGGGETIPMA